MSQNDENLRNEQWKALTATFVARLRDNGRNLFFGADADESSDDDDDLIIFMEKTKKKRTPLWLRSDVAALAVLFAKVALDDSSLLRQLKRGHPAVVIEMSDPDAFETLKEVITACALPSSATVVSRLSSLPNSVLLLEHDGTYRDHRPDKNNGVIRAALAARITVIGIAPDPVRYLPRDLVRTAVFSLRIPPLDPTSIAMTIEVVTGEYPKADIDSALAAVATLADLSLAARGDRSADECLRRLVELVEGRRTVDQDGPTLRDLKGYGAASAWGLDACADIELYRRGQISWNEVDGRAVLLAGPPGTGKTSFAAAFARTAELPLVRTSVAEWNAASHLGGTLQAVRTAFEDARKASPCVLFIDELDGISSRANLKGDYVEYWSQIVNLFLESLTNVEPGVIVIGATNFPERIDAALRRSGRFDRQIDISLPGPDEIADIIRFYLGDDLADADLATHAHSAVGASGADIETFVRRARGRARRAGRALSADDLAVELRGNATDLSQEARWRVAVHEAGHAIACLALGSIPFKYLALRGTGGGYTSVATFGQTDGLDKALDLLTVLAAGRAAEIEVCGYASFGAGMVEGSDLAIATDIALAIETRSGLGELGPIYLPSSIPALAMHEVQHAIRRRLATAADRAQSLVRSYRSPLEDIAKSLCATGYLKSEDLRSMFAARLEAGARADVCGLPPSEDEAHRATAEQPATA